MKLNFSVALPSTDQNGLEAPQSPPEFRFEVLDDTDRQAQTKLAGTKLVVGLNPSRSKQFSVFQDQMARLQDMSGQLQNELAATHLWVDCLRPDKTIGYSDQKERFDQLSDKLEAEIIRLKSGLSFLDLNADPSNTRPEVLASELRTAQVALKALEAEVVLKDAQIASLSILRDENEKFSFVKGLLEANLVSLKAKLDATLQTMSGPQLALGKAPTLQLTAEHSAPLPASSNQIYQARYEEALAESRRHQLRVKRLERTLTQTEAEQTLLFNKVGQISAIQRLLGEANETIEALNLKVGEAVDANDRLNQKIEKLKNKNKELFQAQETNSRKRQQLQLTVESLEKALGEATRKNELLLERMKLLDDEKNMEMTTMTETLVNFEERESSFLTEKSHLERRVGELDELLRLQKSDGESVRQGALALKTALQTLEDEYARKNFAFAALEKQFYAQGVDVSRLRQEVLAGLERVGELEREVRFREEVIASEKNQRLVLASQLGEAQRQNEDLREQVETLRTREEQKDHRIGELEELLREGRDQLARSQHDLDQEKEAKEEAISRVRQLESIIEDLRRKLAMAGEGQAVGSSLSQEEISRLENELERLGDEVRALQKEKGGLAAELESRKRGEAAFKARVETLTTEVEGLKSKLNKQAEQIRSLTTENAALAKEKAELAKQLATSRQEARALALQVDELKRKAAEATRETELLQRALVEAQKELGHLRSQVDSLILENKSVRTQVTLLTGEGIGVPSLTTDGRGLAMTSTGPSGIADKEDPRLAALKKDRQELQERLTEARGQQEALQQRVQELTASVFQVTQELEQEKQKHELDSQNQQSEVSFLTRRLEALETEVAEQHLKSLDWTRSNPRILPMAQAPPAPSQKKELADLRKTNEAMRKKTEALEELLADKQRSLLGMVAKKTAVVPDSFSEEMQSLEREAQLVPGLREQIAQLTEKVDVLERELNAKALKLAQFEGRPLVEMTDDIKRRLADFGLKEREVEHLRETLGNSQRTTQALKDDLQELQKRLIEEKERNGEAQKVSRQMFNETVLQLTNELQVARAQKTELEEQLEGAKGQLAAAFHQLKSDREKQEQEFRETLQKAARTAEDLSQKIQLKREKIGMLKQRVADLENNVDLQRRGSIAGTMGALDSPSSKGGGSQGQMATVRRERDALKKEVESLQSQLEEIKRLFALQRSPVNLNEELRGQIEEASAARSELEAERTRAQGLESRVKELEELVGFHEGKIESLVQEAASRNGVDQQSMSLNLLQAIRSQAAVPENQPEDQVEEVAVNFRPSKKVRAVAGELRERAIDPSEIDEAIGLRNTNQGLEEEVSRLKTQLTRAEEAADGLTKELAALKSNSSREGLSEASQKQVALLKQEVQLLKNSVEERDQRIQQLTGQAPQAALDKALQERNQLTEALSKKERELVQARNEVQKLTRGQNDSPVQQENVKLAEQIRGLEAKLATATSQIAQKEEEIQRIIREERKKTEGQNEESRKKQDELQAQIVRLTNKLASLEKARQETPGRPQAPEPPKLQEGKLGSVTAENESLKAQIVAIRADNERLAGETAQFSRDLAKKSKELSSTQAQISILQSNLSLKSGECSQLEGRLAGLLQELDAERTLKKSLEAKLLEVRGVEVGGSGDSLKTELANALRSLKERTEKAEALQKILTEIRAAEAARNSQFAVLQAEIQKVSVQLQQSQLELLAEQTSAAMLAGQVAKLQEALGKLNEQNRTAAEQNEGLLTKLRAQERQLQEANWALESQKQKSQEAESQLNSLRKSYQESEARLSSLESEYAVAQRNLRALKDEKSAATELADNATRKLASLHQHSERVGQQVGQLSAALKEKTAELETEKRNTEALNQKISLLTKRVAGLEADLETQRSLSEKSASEARRAKESGLALQNELSRVSADKESAERQLRDRQGTLSARETEIAGLNRKLASLEAELTKLVRGGGPDDLSGHNPDKCRAQALLLRSQNDKLAAEREDAKAEAGLLKLQMWEMQRQGETDLEARRRLQKEKDGLGDLKNQLEARLTEASLENESLLRKSRDLESANREMSSAQATLTEHLASTQRELEAAQAQVREKSEELANLSRQMDVFSQRLTIWKEEKEKLGEALRQKVAETNNVRQELKEAQDEVRKVKFERAAKIEELREVQRQGAEREKLLAEKKAAVEALEVKCREMESQLMGREAKLQAAISDGDFARQRAEELDRQCTDLRAELMAVKRELGKLQLEMDAKTRRLDSVELQLDGLHSEINQHKRTIVELESELAEWRRTDSGGQGIPSGSGVPKEIILKKTVIKLEGELQVKSTEIATLSGRSEELIRKVEDLVRQNQEEKDRASQSLSVSAAAEFKSRALAEEVEESRRRLESLQGQFEAELTLLRQQLVASKAALSRSELATQKAEEERKALALVAESLQMEASRLNEGRRELESALSQEKSDHQTTKGLLKRAEGEAEFNRSQVRVLTENEKELRMTMDRILAQFRPDNTQLLAKLAIMTQENATFKGEVESLKARIRALELEGYDWQKQFGDSAAIRVELEEELARTSQSLAEIQAQQATKSSQIESLKAQNMQMQLQIKQLRVKLESVPAPAPPTPPPEVVVDLGLPSPKRKSESATAATPREKPKSAMLRSKMEATLRSEVAQLTQKSSALEDQVEKLTHANGVASAASKEFQQKWTVAQQELDRTVVQLRETQNQIKRLSTGLNKSQKELEAVRAKLKQAEGKENRTNSQVRQLMESKMVEIDQANLQQAEEKRLLADKVSRLQAELDKANGGKALEGLKRLKAEREQFRDDAERLAHELGLFKAAHKEATAKLAQAKALEHKRSLEVAALQAELGELRRESEQLEQGAREWESRWRELRRERDDASRRISILEEERAVYQESLSNVQQTVISDDLMAQIRNIPLLSTQVVTLKAELEIQKRVNQQTASDLDEAENKTQSLRESEQKLHRALRDSQVQAQRAAEDLDAASLQLESMTSKVGSLEAELAQKSQSIVQLEQELAVTRTRVSQKERLAAELEERVGRLRREMAAEYARVAGSFDEGPEAGEVEILEGQLDQFKRQFGEKDRQLKSLTAEVATLRSKLKDKTQECSVLEERTAKLTNQNDSLSLEVSTHRQEAEMLAGKVKVLTAEVTSLKNDLGISRQTLLRTQEEHNRQLSSRPTVVQRDDTHETLYLTREIQTLKTENEELRQARDARVREEARQVQELQAKVSRLEAETRTLMDRIRTQEADRTTFLRNEEETQAKMTQLKSQVSQLERFKVENESLAKRIATLESDLNLRGQELQATVVQLEEHRRVAALPKSNPQDEAELRRLRDQVTIFQREIVERNSSDQTAHFQSANQQLTLELTDSRRKLKESEAEKQRLEAQLTSLRQSTDSELASLRSEIKTLRTQLTERDDAMALLQTQLTRQEKEWRSLEAQLKLRLESLGKNKGDNSLDAWQDVVGSLGAVLKLSKTVLENQKGEKVVDAADFSVSEESVAGYSQNAMLQIEKVKKFLKELLSSIDKKNLEAERQRLLASSLENSALVFRGVGPESLRDLLASTQRVAGFFSALITAIAPDRAIKIATHDILSDDPNHYIETVQSYFSDFESYHSLLRETITERQTELVRLRKLESDIKLGRVRVGCLEDFKDIDAKLLKANKLLVEGIRMIGKTETGLRESGRPSNDRPEEWLETIMEDFEEGLSLGKILLNDVKILSNEKKKVEKKLADEAGKVKRFEVTPELQRLVDSLNQVSMLLDSLASEQGVDAEQIDAAPRLSSLKFQTSEESMRSMGEFVVLLASRLRAVLTNLTDLRNENKQLKSAEKEIRSSLKSSDIQRNISGLYDKMKVLLTEITEISGGLGVATSLSLPKMRMGSEETGGNVQSLTRLAEALGNLCKDIGGALAARNTEMDKLRSMEFQIKSTKMTENRLADFVAMAKEAQGLNFQARRILNNDISRYVQEIGVPAQNSDEAIDVFFSLSKSTGKYLDQIQANQAKLGLEVERLKQAAAEPGDEAERQGFRMTVTKNTQLTERVKSLEAENQRLREEAEESARTTRTTSRVRMETATRREEREETENLRSEVLKYKREATTALEEAEQTKRQIRGLKEQIGELEFELERARGRRGRETDSKLTRGNGEVEALEAELARTKTRNREAQEEWEDKLGRLRREKAEAEGEVERLRTQLDKLKKVERENEELRRDLARVRSRVASNL